MLKGIVGATHHATGNGPEALRKGLGQIQMIGHLLKILMKAIVLKKTLIIGRVVLHTKSGTGKTLNKQPPEIIIFTKVNGSIHRLHTLALQPFFGRIEQEKSRITIIYALKKTHPAGSLGKTIGLLFVYESGHPGPGLSRFRPEAESVWPDHA